MRAWHGSSALFSNFDLQNFGNGEGGRHSPFGVYLAENREGGEYFARYLHQRDGSGYLYEVEVRLSPSEILDEDVSQRQSIDRLGETILSLEDRYSDYKLAAYMQARGIHCFRLWEGTKPGHGYTFRCLSPERIHILRRYQYDPKSASWRELE